MIRYHWTVDGLPPADAVKVTGSPLLAVWLTGEVTMEGGVTGWVAVTVTSSSMLSTFTVAVDVSLNTSVVFVVVAVKVN